MQLAQNSYNAHKYSRAADNCRLAAEFAFNEENKEGAAEAYQLWIKSLLKLSKLSDVKKICCDARSKFGNHLDLVYYEYVAALNLGSFDKANKLGNQFLELACEKNADGNEIFIESIDKLDEVRETLGRNNKVTASSR